MTPKAAHINMPALVGQYLGIEKAGNVYKALCPFHSDKETKSFTIYASDAYCFGCHRFFGPVGFLTSYLHISKSEALSKLGYKQPSLPSFKKQQKKQIIKTIPLETIRIWHSMLGSHRSFFRGRLFTDETIDRELWGWDGNRYVVTVWDGQPGKKCVSVRRRASKESSSKYIGLDGYNPRVLYGKWHVSNYYQSIPQGLPKVAYIFFGEFDAALATQDGYPSVSPTNGQNAWLEEWDSFFDEFSVIVVPDKGEEYRGYQLASRFPGRASVIKWPDGDFSDYNSFRLAGAAPEDFLCNVVGAAVQPSYAVECFWEVA